MKRISFLHLLAAGVLLLTPAYSPAALALPIPASDTSQASLYTQGTQAINQGRWQDAIHIFDRVAQQHGSYAAGALYWKAYAESQEGQSASALLTCRELRRLYPQSRWLDECGALEISIRGKSGDPVAPRAEQNEDLKLLAMNALMQQDPAQALPVIQHLLESDQPQEIKKRALFILAQNPSPAAQELLGKIARGQSGTALQVQAIRMFAIARGKQSAAELEDIYRQTSNEDVKQVILQSYLLTGSKSPLLQAAREETNPQLAHTAVQTLGVMGATDDLLMLYHATNSAEIKSSIINALITAGPDGASALSEIAAAEQNPELRRKAIRNLGIAGGASKGPVLVGIYQQATDIPTKEAAAQALFLAGDAHDLIALARSEKDPQMKEYLVQQLSLMHNKEASQYMMELLNK